VASSHPSPSWILLLVLLLIPQTNLQSDGWMEERKWMMDGGWSPLVGCCMVVASLLLSCIVFSIDWTSFLTAWASFYTCNHVSRAWNRLFKWSHTFWPRKYGFGKFPKRRFDLVKQVEPLAIGRTTGRTLLLDLRSLSVSRITFTSDLQIKWFLCSRDPLFLGFLSI